MNNPADARRARLHLLIATLLWSTSGAFTKVLTKPSALHLDSPTLNPVQIACLRVLFAGLALSFTLPGKKLTFRPLMIVMILSFAVMNSLFVFATAKSTAANAIFLQSTAPLWMYLASITLLGEKASRHNTIAVLLGMMGIGVIIAGTSDNAELRVVMLALLSGFLYACVVICLRAMRDVASEWLTVQNHLIGGLVVLPFVIWVWPATPSWEQWIVLVIYGVLQMGLPYLLAARSLRHLSPQEVATIMLVEPILNPIWAFLISGEEPGGWTLVGGAFILGALVWRYWPRRRSLRSE